MSSDSDRAESDTSGPIHQLDYASTSKEQEVRCRPVLRGVAFSILAAILFSIFAKIAAPSFVDTFPSALEETGTARMIVVGTYWSLVLVVGFIAYRWGKKRNERFGDHGKGREPLLSDSGNGG